MATRIKLPTITLLLLVLGAGFALLAATGQLGVSVSPAAMTTSIAPAGLGAALTPGGTTTFTVTVSNPGSEPVRVASISAGRSTATSGGCPAGVVTSEASTAPGGTLAAGESATYGLTARMVADPADACQGQRFSLPLTAQLVAAS